ncbi:MAG: hypothetical protein R3359_04765 [Marinirhabdus sp.]|nr:hypothetical protein [Marinirhabdus sp.]
MTTVAHKAKQYWPVALKLLVLVLGFAYIYDKIQAEAFVVGPNISDNFTQHGYLVVVTFLLAATCNWLLEIAKWKRTVGIQIPIGFSEAAKQSLGALTASLITPNRIGEYGAKALYFPRHHRKRILFLNVVHHGAQMGTTVLFGIPAFAIFLYQYRVALRTDMLLYLCIFILGISVLTYLFRKKQLGIQGLSLSNLWRHFKQILMGDKIALLGFSIARYLVFSILFYGILWLFDASATFVTVAPLLCSMYLLASIVPTFFVLDVVVKGSVAVWLFSFAGISEIAVLSTVFIMWVLNVVLPAIIGSYFVLTFKSGSR